jgi:hypothetical protein
MSALDEFDSIVATVKPAAANQTAAPRKSKGPAVDAFDDVVAAVKAAPTPVPRNPDDEPGRVMSTLAGVNNAINRTAGGIMQLGGKGLKAVGDLTNSPTISKLGDDAQENARAGLAKAEAANAPYAEAHPNFNTAGELAGDTAIGIAAPVGKTVSTLGKSANIVNRMIHGAVSGAVGAGVQAVDGPDADFWAEKAKQVGVGAVAGGAGSPIGEAVGKVAGAGLDVLKQGYRKLTGKAATAAEEAVTAGEAQAAADAASAAGKKPAATPESGAPTAANGRVEPRVPDATAPSSSRELVVVPANASPDLKIAIRQAAAEGRPLNPEAIARHIDAERFGIKLTQGQASRDANVFSIERNMRTENTMQPRFAEQEKQLIDALDGIRGDAAPGSISTGRESAGEHIIESLKEVQAKRADEIKAAYQKLADANGGDLPMDGPAFVARATENLHKDMSGAFVPAEFQTIMREIGDGSRPMTFENFENLRTKLASAMRATKDGNVEHALGVVRSALEDMPLAPELEAGAARAIGNGNAGATQLQHVKELADQARKLAREEFMRADPKRGGSAAYKAVADETAAPTDFVAKYLVRERHPEKLAQLAEHLKDDPLALQEIKAGVLHHLQQESTNHAGLFHAEKYNRAVRELGKSIDVIYSPAEAEQIRALGRVATTIKSAPAASHVNYSNTEVARLQHSGDALKEGSRAADLVAGTLNAVVPKMNLGTLVTGGYRGLDQMTQKAAERAAARESLRPGAGVGGHTPRQAKGESDVARKAGAVSLSSFATTNIGKDQRKKNED